MYWKLTVEPVEADARAPSAWDGRFVLHRHRDVEGPHLDLRLEQDGFLVGWRIDAQALEEACWATEKMPHPLAWLEQDGDAVRADQGLYAWLDRDADGGRLLLQCRDGLRTLRAVRRPGLRPAVFERLHTVLNTHRIAPEYTPDLVADGVTARQRAIARLCGLGRELDEAAFDEPLWRKAVDGLRLDEIHAHLRAFERRFDEKHPPQPVSRPEPLPEEDRADRTDEAMAILRG